MTGARRWSVGVLLLACLAPLAGCEQKLTYERWQLINQGSSGLEVENAIGKPTFTMDDQWTYEDHDRHITAHIYYEKGSDRVLTKQWYDPEHGWQGKNPDEVREGERSEGTPSIYRSEQEK